LALFQDYINTRVTAFNFSVAKGVLSTSSLKGATAFQVNFNSVLGFGAGA
jgi:hypothetical protein